MTSDEKAAAVVTALRDLEPGDTAQVRENAPFPGMLVTVNSLHPYGSQIFVDVDVIVNGVTQVMGYYIEELRLV